MSDTSTVPAREGGDEPQGGRARAKRRGPLRVVTDKVRGGVTFYKQVVAELRKVIWPSRQQLLTYTSVVLVFVAVMVVIVSIFDFAFGQGVLAVFGDSS